MNYENKKKHTFTVKATIMKIFEAYATVIINVLDVNDECPTLPATMTIKYRGNPDVGDVIGTVKATDVDSTTLYSMTTTDLSVNPTTGAITTTQSFAYSHKKTQVYTITASDSGNNCPSVNTQLTLDLETCTNPEDYQFTESKYVRTYKENRTLGILFKVSIRKVTLSRNYSIVYPATTTVQRYSINSNTGDISLIKPLDYETDKEEHFQVKAVFSDGVTSLAEVTIIVLDVNDECPQFTTSSTTVYITEPSRAGTYVTQAVVTDQDTSSLNTHTFSLSGDNAFQIDARGVVTVKSYYQSSRKVSTFEHNMTITINDAGCTPRTQALTVVVFKVLLQEYIFSRPMYKYEISEDQTVPHLIDCFKNLFNHTGVYRLKYTNSTCFSLSSTGLFVYSSFFFYFQNKN